MPRFTAATPARLSPLLLALALGGCSTISEFFSGEKVDYKNQPVRARPLEVPPDLTQLARENRYAMQGGVVSAAGTPGAGGPAQSAGAVQPVAPLSIADMRIERDGNERWLLVRMPPEQLWPQIRAFWQERGFSILTENAEAGVIETDWQMDRAKLPNDAVRNALGRFFSNVMDSGERDRFITRVERTAGGSEVYIRHRGLIEVYVNQAKDQTEWRARPSDPNLEAEYLSRLMVKLGAKEDAAKTVVAQAPQTAARARALSGNTALEVDEPFERAWRRVGVALDRGGFTVEDRDRAGGLYYVRYVDPKNAGVEEPGFFARLFGAKSGGDKGPVRYRITLKGQGEKTVVSVLTSAGAAEVGETGQRIVQQLVTELR